jgi:hypothetical protein
MRRVVILCLLLWLPWSWSWAAQGGSGAQECGCIGVAAETGDLAHAGHEAADEPCADSVAGQPCDPDCADCPGQTLAGGLGLPALPLAQPANRRERDFAQPFRNHIPDRLLRPPPAVRV